MTLMNWFNYLNYLSLLIFKLTKQIYDLTILPSHNVQILLTLYLSNKFLHISQGLASTMLPSFNRIITILLFDKRLLSFTLIIAFFSA